MKNILTFIVFIGLKLLEVAGIVLAAAIVAVVGCGILFVLFYAAGYLVTFWWAVDMPLKQIVDRGAGTVFILMLIICGCAFIPNWFRKNWEWAKKITNNQG